MRSFLTYKIASRNTLLWYSKAANVRDIWAKIAKPNKSYDKEGNHITEASIGRSELLYILPCLSTQRDQLMLDAF